MNGKLILTSRATRQIKRYLSRATKAATQLSAALAALNHALLEARPVLVAWTGRVQDEVDHVLSEVRDLSEAIELETDEE